MKEWLQALLRAGCVVMVPEIADYEIRRELLRAEKAKGVERLDALKAVGYLPLSTNAMLKAAEYWAQARQEGLPTASDEALDADVVLAAQAIVLDNSSNNDVVVATANVGHLSRFVRAELWKDIRPEDC
jgi:predicted nucleic acid-binding protein